MRAFITFAAAIALLAIAGISPAAAPTTITPGQLTVGVNLPSDGFQVGAVRGTDVVVAKGLEIDLARTLAARLGLAKTRFVQSRFDRLFSSGPKPWDLSIAQITITDRRRLTADFSISYMSADEGVLLAQTVATTPKTIAALRPLGLCALAKSTGADLINERIKPLKPPLFVGNVARLMLDLQTGRCEAVVYDAPTLGTLKARAPLRYGAFAGVIRTGEQYGIALPKGSRLTPRVNAALRTLIAQGYIQQLQRKWLTANLARLPVLS
jgi:polar amino acid transport system substrate-binding protein